MQEMDVILPILNLVNPDGTLFLKEYLLNSGHCRGFAVATGLNGQICSKVLIDNCSVSEEDMEQLLYGFSQLEALRSCVLRRSIVGVDCIPHLSVSLGKIFPHSLTTLKIEKC